MADAPTLPQPLEFAERFGADQSDLTVGVLGGSYLEALLTDLLRAYLVEGSEAKELTGQAFIRKAKATFALGLISRDSLDDLVIIADVRNYFAHRVLVTSASFTDEEVVSLCGKLSLARQAQSDGRDFLKELGYEVDSPRAHYIEALTACASEIAYRRDHPSFTPAREAEPVRRLGLAQGKFAREIFAELGARDRARWPPSVDHGRAVGAAIPRVPRGAVGARWMLPARHGSSGCARGARCCR